MDCSLLSKNTQNLIRKQLRKTTKVIVNIDISEETINQRKKILSSLEPQINTIEHDIYDIELKYYYILRDDEFENTINNYNEMLKYNDILNKDTMLNITIYRQRKFHDNINRLMERFTSKISFVEMTKRHEIIQNLLGKNALTHPVLSLYYMMDEQEFNNTIDKYKQDNTFN